MRTDRLGCFTIPGFLLAVVTFTLVTGITLVRGGRLFSPGALNAQGGGQILGGVSAHTDIARCASCHAAPWAAQKMSDRCLACHVNISKGNDWHILMYAQGLTSTCQSCHTDHHGPQASLTDMSLAKFPHESMGYSLSAHLLNYDQSPFACQDCHQNQLTTMDLAVCMDCHQSHDDQLMGDHVAAFGTACLDCHDGLDTYGRRFDHAQVAFPLEGQHRGLSCGECHAEARLISDMQAAPQDCFSCHQKDEPHEARFGQDCAVCHTAERWKPARFDHQLADFQLVGKHVQVECQACHVNDIYRGTPKDCFSCHAKDDAHGGFLGADCARCHTSEGWKPSIFDHSLSVFPLTGKHIAVACQSCHQDLAFKGTPQVCFACHSKVDAHNGQFGTDCAQCHSTTGWKPATFNHSLSAFPLTGAHVSASCQSCHGAGKFKGTPQDCYACHSGVDEHNGKFGANCGQCHSTSSWKGATFDHSLASFKLTGAHSQAACTSCHGNGQFQGMPSACVACHAEPGVHAGLFGTKCADCHNTSAWLPASYNGPHSFPMDHGGRNACSACHPNSLTSWTCYSCHDQGEIDHKHREEGISDYSNCLSCHPTGQEEEGGEGGDDD